MSTSRKFDQTIAVLITTIVLVVASSGNSVAAPQASLTAGDKCTVKSGPNKGETGTYGADGWCEGDWGGTECGTTKCKVAAASVVVRVNPPSRNGFMQQFKLRTKFKLGAVASMAKN